MSMVLAALATILLVGAIPMDLTRDQVVVYTILYFLPINQILFWLLNGKGPRPKGKGAGGSKSIL